MTQPLAPHDVEPRSTTGFVDMFGDDRRAGQVVDTSTADGVPRHVTDVERVISIDHGALRIRPMIEQGWGRAMVTYGPIERIPGTMLAVLVLNGHNTSQSEPLPDSFQSRVLQWALGHASAPRSLAIRRLGQWLRYPRKRYMVRKLRTWNHMARGGVDRLDENLAVGWFTSRRPGAPGSDGNAFVMHAALGDNGELWSHTEGALLPVATGIQNLPMCYVTILRAQGAAYYLGSLPRAHGAAPYPLVRPLGIDTGGSETTLYAGVHQAALGQIGFRVDTRVYGIQVSHVPEFAEWFGTACIADRMIGDGEPAAGSTPDIGLPWIDADGAFVRTPAGLRSIRAGTCAVRSPTNRIGLVHVHVTPLADGTGSFGLLLRSASDGTHCRLELSPTSCRLLAVDADGPHALAEQHGRALTFDQTSRVQVVDDGTDIRVAIDGIEVFGGSVQLPDRLAGDGVGVFANGTGAARFERFEAHPAEIDLGKALRLAAPWQQDGDVTLIADDFGGAEGSDLDGRVTPVGGVAWTRSYGQGRIVVAAGCAAVDASTERPNPGSTAYTVPWSRPDLVDVSVDVTPPGSGAGEHERGRGGLLLWDDELNFISISMYVDDGYDGASIAIFSHLDGFEDIYDAVWSMVSQKIYWGRTHRLRVVSDGMHVLVYIDDEPVLYRALSDIYVDREPMTINRVGIVVNWEWGDDTGTSFGNFSARARGSST